VSGLTDREIARDLGIAHATVRFHLESARRKVGARSRTHLAALAVALGVASPSSIPPSADS
jgi:DNA-binding CsgD family transcriptional regulator